MMSKIVTHKIQLAVAVLVVAFVLLWPGSCTKHDVRPTLRVQLSNEPVTLDFSLAEDGVSLRVLSALMTGLVSYDRNYELKMEIAESMEKLDGGRRYRFKLRPWKWSDGKPVVASDFAYAMRRTLDPGTSAKLADLLFFIKGARHYKTGVLKDFSRVGISVVSESVLEFELDAPVSFFPHVLTMPIGYPQRADIVDKLGAQWPEHMVSTGPYRLQRWLHDQRIEIEQNPSYVAFDDKAPAKVLFQIIPEEATAVNLFENKRIDVLFKVPSFDLDRLRNRNVVKEFPYFATYYVAFDQRQAPWADPKARLAVAQAINKQAIIDALGGDEVPATSWIPNGLPGYNPNIGVKYNPVAAKEQWKHSQGRSAKALLLGYDTSFRNQTIVERIQSDLKEALGISIRLRNRDWKTYLRDLGIEPPAMYRFGWLSPFVDAYANLTVFQSGNPNNYTGWKNTDYDALVQKIAVLEPGSPTRQQLVDAAQRILLEQAVVVVPIFHYVQSIIVSERVKDFRVNGIGMVDYMGVRLGK